jgi:hypothetical protein
MSNPTPDPYPLRRCARGVAPALLAACAAAVFASASAPVQAQPVAPVTAPAPAAVSAVDDPEVGLWRAAYLRVARLAEAGDAGAARLALRMRHLVPRLFGSPLQLSAAQLRRWAALVAQDDWANCDVPSAETLRLLQG